MKYFIYVLMVVILVSIVNAQGLGNCALGNYPIGNCVVEPTPITTISGGGGTLGTNLCSSGTFNFFGNCLNLTYAEFANFFKGMFSGQGVLEYRLLTQKQAFSGETITIINQFENEGKEPVEINCKNFLDINNDAIISNDEPITSFNKFAEPQIKNYYNVTLDIPDNLEEGSYLIGGRCDLLNSNMPNATAGNKIKILQQKINVPKTVSLSKFSIQTEQIIWGLVVILGVFILFKSGLWVLLIGWLQTLATLLVAMGLAGLLLVLVVLVYLYFKYWR